MSKHTKGPWETHIFDDAGWEIHPANDEDGYFVIAEVDPEEIYGREIMKANARLIAAAPDLLEAAKILADKMSSGVKGSNVNVAEEVGKLRRAIVKAEKGV